MKLSWIRELFTSYLSCKMKKKKKKKTCEKITHMKSSYLKSCCRLTVTHPRSVHKTFKLCRFCSGETDEQFL